MRDFVQATGARYGLRRLQLVPLDVRAGLAVVHAQHPELRAFVTGKRSSDPHAQEHHFTPPTAGWPQLMRVAPILHWGYADVWRFLRHPAAPVPYPALYERGFTSLGTAANSRPNPALRNADGSYRAAWLLEDEALERDSRI